MVSDFGTGIWTAARTAGEVLPVPTLTRTPLVFGPALQVVAVGVASNAGARFGSRAAIVERVLRSDWLPSSTTPNNVALPGVSTRIIGPTQSVVPAGSTAADPHGRNRAVVVLSAVGAEVRVAWMNDGMLERPASWSAMWVSPWSITAYSESGSVWELVKSARTQV